MKLRLIINGVSMYTTSAAIKRGIGDHSTINVVAQMALHNMLKNGDIGCGGQQRVYDSKMKCTSYDYQINRM